MTNDIFKNVIAVNI